MFQQAMFDDRRVLGMSGFFDTLRPREFSWQFKDQPKVKPLKQYPPFPGDSMVRNGDLMGY